MRITLVLVTSVNSKLTRGSNPNIYEWTSQADQKHFFDLIAQHNLIIMGRKTYEGAKSVIQLTPEKLRIVLSQSPDRYTNDEVPGQLQFSNQEPRVLISSLEKQGYTDALLVGGSDVAYTFLKEKLVTSLLLTIEPYIFGSGTDFLNQGKLDIALSLMSATKLNSKGTMLLEYLVKNQ